MKSNIFFPSILTDSLDTAQQQLNLVQNLVERVQIDIIDGEFTDNITIHPVDVKDLNIGDVKIDLHLMTNDPINDVVECENIPNLNSITAQIEHMHSQQDFVDHVRSYGWKVGLSLDLYTDETEISDDVLARLDILQIMTIHAGRQGLEFQPSALEKIRRCAVLLKKVNPSCELIVDGGIANAEIWKQCKEAGATGAAVGTALWSSLNVAEALQKLLY